MLPCRLPGARKLSGGARTLDLVAFATEIPGSARSLGHAQPDVPVAHSEFRPVGDIPREGGHFEVVSDYQPAGDQPAAIEELERRLRAGEQDVVLLGATGTGKSATTAWLIERLQRPTLVMAPNKTLAAQLANELREMLPNNAVEYFVSYYDYYQPEAYIAQTDTYIEKDSSINEDVERLRHSATMQPAVPPGRGRGGLGVLHLRPGHAAVLPGPLGGAAGRRHASSGTRCCGPWSTSSTPATTWPSTAAPSGSAGTRWRSSRRTRSWPSGSSSSATRSRRSTTCTRSPGTCCARSTSCASSRPRTTWPAGSGWSGRSGTSRPSWPSGWPSWRGRASCWRRSGCACAPSTTSR